MKIKKVKQHDVRDCGAACLATICSHFGLNIPLITVRQEMKIDKNGANLLAITETAKKFSLHADALFGNWSELLENIGSKSIKLPIMAHVISRKSLTHYIIIEKITDKNIIVFNPSRGKQKYKIDQFEKIWTGYMVTFKPMESFVKQDMGKGRMKKYLEIITKQKKFFIMATIISLFLAGTSIVCSLAYQRIIDKFILGGMNSIETMSQIPVFTGVMSQIKSLCNNLEAMFLLIISLYLFQALLYAVRGVIITQIFQKSSKLIMFKFYRHFLGLPLSFFQDRDTGEILSRYNDMEEIQDVLSGIGLSIIMDGIMAIAGGFVLSKINSILFSLVIIWTISYCIVVMIYRIPIRDVNRDIMEKGSQVMSTLKESIEGIETIKSTLSEDYYYDVLESKTAEMIYKEKTRGYIGTSQSTILMIIDGIGSLAVLWIGSKLVIEGMLSLGTLIAFESLMYFFIAPVQGIVGIQQELQKATIAAERLDDIFEVKHEETICQEQVMVNTSNRELRIENVSFQYGYREKMLDNISIIIRPATKLAIVGANGCGKTTLLHIFASMQNDYSGEMFWGNDLVKKNALNSIKKEIIYVPQNTILFSGTIKENILLGKQVEDEIFNSIIRNCGVLEITEKMEYGINTQINENGKCLSGGQRQMISLARALIQEPKVLLLDESTSYIDGHSEKKILDYIDESYNGITCIFVTHKVKIMERCDEVVYMEKGKIIAKENHKILLNNCKEYKHFVKCGE